MLTFLMAGGVVIAALGALAPAYALLVPYTKRPSLQLTSAAADRLMWRGCWLGVLGFIIAISAALVRAHIG